MRKRKPLTVDQIEMRTFIEVLARLDVIAKRRAQANDNVQQYDDVSVKQFEGQR